MHHAMRVLAAVELGTTPLHAGIGRAFEKIDLVDPRQPLELVQCEDERLFDKPVQHQPVIRRIDLGDTAVVAFKAEPVGGDDSVQLVQRREAYRRFRRRRQPRHRTTDHILFVFGGIAVGSYTDAFAELACPISDVGRKILGVVRARVHRTACCKSGGTDNKTTACRPRSIVRVSHRNLPADRLPGALITFYFVNVIAIATNPRKFSRSYSVQAALFCSRQRSVQPAPKPADLRCLR